MKGLARLRESSIGRKVLMAVTGIMLIGFLLGHLTGNLLIFGGREALNDYAWWLHDHPKMLWGARIGLLVVFGAHVAIGLSLQAANRRARPVAYHHPGSVQLRTAAQTMLATGILVFAYLIYHLLHFTFGQIQSANAALLVDGKPDTYGMVVAGFGNPIVAISYLVALAILGAHLSHGISSFFQTLGIQHPRYTPWIRRLGTAAAWILAALYATIPLAVMFGIIPQPGS